MATIQGSQILLDKVKEFIAHGRSSVLSQKTDHIAKSYRQTRVIQEFLESIKKFNLPNAIFVTNTETDWTYIFFAETEKDVLDRLGEPIKVKTPPTDVLVKMLYSRIRSLLTVRKDPYLGHRVQPQNQGILHQDINTVQKLQDLLDVIPRWYAPKPAKDTLKILAKHPVTDEIVAAAWRLYEVDIVMES